MVTAIRIHAHGGPEVLAVEDMPLADPGPGEALVRNEAVGLNFFDTYQRSGLYTRSSCPPRWVVNRPASSRRSAMA